MMGIETIADLAAKGGDPELELTAKLFNAAFESSFGMMSKAWTGWGDKKSASSDDGMGCFLSPLESTVKTLNDELMKGVEDLYKSYL